ncbi:unnamed protein product [Linum tenue]|uniref:Uncharacterized protein n=1 Tax=Linum tenue TaxID=586396 RepID=A0AAV0RKS7_9ROSI|nr:unnamed protein product [Linum tenue]
MNLRCTRVFGLANAHGFRNQRFYGIGIVSLHFTSFSFR